MYQIETVVTHINRV